jgi:hypothetical protein
MSVTSSRTLAEAANPTALHARLQEMLNSTHCVLVATAPNAPQTIRCLLISPNRDVGHKHAHVRCYTNNTSHLCCTTISRPNNGLINHYGTFMLAFVGAKSSKLRPLHRKSYNYLNVYYKMITGLAAYVRRMRLQRRAEHRVYLSCVCV